MSRQSRAIFGKVANQAQAVTRSMRRVAAIGLGAIMVAAGLAAREYVQFDQAITASSAKFKDMNLATAEGQKKLEQLGKTAREVGASTQFTATQAAEGLDFLAMAGFSANQAMASLAGVVDLATVGQIDLARATDIASDTLGAFGLMTEDTAQLQANFTRINDVMAKTITSSNTNMEALFESVKKGAPAFTAAGQSMETFAAFAGIMANSGVKGAESGTQLRNMMLKLAAPSAEAAKILQNLGIQTEDADGNFLDAIDILAQFEKSLVGMGTAQKSAALATIFGTRSVTGINLLLQAGTKQLRQFRDELKGSAGAAQDMSDIIRKSLLNRLAALKSAAIEVGFQFFDKIKGQAAGAIEKLTQVVRNLPIEQIIENMGNVIRKALPVLRVFWDGFKWLTKNWDLVVAGYLAITAAQIGMNAAMTANPVGAVISSLVAMVAVAVLIVKHWDQITETLKNTWNWFDKLLGNPWIRLALSLIAQPILAIAAAIRTVIDLVSGKGLGESLLNLTDTLGGIWAAGRAAAGVFGLGKGQSSQITGPPGTEIGMAGGGTTNTPVSPFTSVVESLKTERAQLDVNFIDMPPARTRMTGNAPGITVNTGPAFNRRMSDLMAAGGL